MRSPFFGDYNYVSAAGPSASSVWTDTRDLPPGQDPRETGADDDTDGFDGCQTCTWVPERHQRRRVQLADHRRSVPVPGRPEPEHLRGHYTVGRASLDSSAWIRTRDLTIMSRAL